MNSDKKNEEKRLLAEIKQRQDAIDARNIENEVDGNHIEQMKLALAKLRYGIAYGVIVTSKERPGEFIVTKLDTSWQDVPWAYGCPRKKDGTWSKKEICLYGHWLIKDFRLKKGR